MIKKNVSIFILLQITCLLQAKQPITLFCHGIVDNKNQMDRYHQHICAPQKAFDFDDTQEPSGWNLNNLIFQCASCFGKRVNLDKMYMGHDQDTKTVAQNIDPHETYILYGMSRGGSTIINYIAEYNPKNICALVIDGAPADMVENAVNLLQYKIGYQFALERNIQESIFNAIFPRYQINSIPPVQNIEKIEDKNIAIFIVHSYEDSTVDILSAWKNYIAFKNNGFNKVYLCQLRQGKHGHYMHDQDKDIYLKALHSFYKHHNFIYHEEFADFDLEILQPSIQTIETQLIEYQKNLETNYQTNKVQLQKIVTLSSTAIFLALSLYLYK